MNWENGYISNITLEDAEKDYEDIHKMMKEYDDQITAINNKLEMLKNEFGKGTAQRMLNLEGMKSNLLYAYKGLCSNEKAIKERVERLRAERYGISKSEAGV